MYSYAFCNRGSVNVRFAPEATEVLRCRELTGCANALNRCAIARCAVGLAASTIPRGEIVGSGRGALS